jgi:dipeptide/tripeptide permease
LINTGRQHDIRNRHEATGRRRPRDDGCRHLSLFYGGFGIGSLVTAAILGLSLVVAPWLAAVIVGVVLLIIASVLAMIGRREVSQATPVLPEESMQSVRRDVEAVKEGIHVDRS